MNNVLLEDVSAYIQKITNEDIQDRSANLFELGLLTSLDVLDIISYLENNFGIELSDEDVDMHHFGTIDGLVSLVERKTKEQ
ncbi:MULTISPECIES: acyl carrier protein [unclassified Paenibacillus]|uniref:acyl carrier protein n=1 Tax=unclassified Paenibacillus TaxID=185978 RepID=UPI0030F5024B